jgi:Family of unknown function (DUF5690)
MIRSTRLTAWLERAPRSVFAAYAGSAAFATYFSMYAFRKPFAAASFAGMHLWGSGIELKTAFVVSQIIGYTISKFVGIKVCSEITAAGRAAALLGLIAVAEAALLLFAVLPPDWRVVAMLLNGLPLGMVWGLVVAYLEGRRTSELLLAGLSCSFIVSSGVVKDVGSWLMKTWAVSESWMPFTTGLLFAPLFVLSVGLLDHLPRPSEADVAARAERAPMDAGARHHFLRQFFPGLASLIVVYFFLTAYRDFRDNYGVEIFNELGYGGKPAIFTKTELPVAFGVMASLALLSFVRDNKRGLLGAFGIMGVGAALLGIATVLLDLGRLSGATWMLLVGLGSYLVYVPFNSVLFDRMIAYTRVRGTAVFAIYVSDAVGYSGSVGIQIFKDIGRAGATRLAFFRSFTYVTSAVALVLLTASGLYFFRFDKRRRSI